MQAACNEMAEFNPELGDELVESQVVRDVVSEYNILTDQELREITEVRVTETAEATLKNGDKVQGSVETKRFAKLSDKQLDKLRDDRYVQVSTV